MLPSAAAFVDSAVLDRFPLTLLGIERLAALLESRRVLRRAVAAGFRPPLDGVQRHDAGRGRSHGALRRRLLRRLSAVRRLRAVLDVLFRGRELRRDGARVAPERAAAGFLRAADPRFASALRALSPRAASADLAAACATRLTP
jgi:hypothetical protein